MLTGHQRLNVPEQALVGALSGTSSKESPPATATSPALVTPSGLDEPRPIRQEAVSARKSSLTPSPAPVVAPAPKPVQRPSAVEQSPPSEYPGANLTVSGIAWQEERSLRRAVVNGSLLGEGAEVAGARIVEIGERRVKFSQGGRTISVSLSSPFQGR